MSGRIGWHIVMNHRLSRRSYDGEGKVSYDGEGKVAGRTGETEKLILYPGDNYRSSVMPCVWGLHAWVSKSGAISWANAMARGLCCPRARSLTLRKVRVTLFDSEPTSVEDKIVGNKREILSLVTVRVTNKVLSSPDGQTIGDRLFRAFEAQEKRRKNRKGKGNASKRRNQT